MKTILIYPEDIIPSTRYMHDSEGRYDLLGQILYTGYGVKIPPKTRTPQDLQEMINLFVVKVRGYTYTMTPLCQQLLALSSLPGKKQVEEANKLLAPYKIRLVLEGEEI